ncbi:AAA domain-containing protein [Microvirga sp. Mcv34]|uniref:AAA domain-containing protein n=1 Tax=Microvirga sp. Mcv34 TaxID=2926016 RepID=UPI0021CA1BF1|nr:AAA domain-containing protein [Microvirga sp. Mcv34]
MSGRKSKSGFLSDYALDDKYLLRPDRKQGRAGIDTARTRDSREVLIKTWPRVKGIDDQDLEIIWRSEIRQLQRLSAVPRADELIVPMVASGKDKDGFYLVLDPGQGSPLDVLLNVSRKPLLLAQARQPRSRRLLWANILRLVNGVELLHSQGTIHRNIDPWSVVTALGDEPDFRLTGFEWSMRIVAADAVDGKTVKAPREERTFSFARDWRDLAHLTAIILDIPIGPLNDLKIVASRVADHVPAAEVRLLRAMLGLEHVERLDGDYIATRIQAIIDDIAAEVAGKDASLCLAVRLGSGSPLSEAVRRASNGEIEIADDVQQLRFMRDDLGEQVQLLAIREGVSARYVLLGQRLTYRLMPYRRPNSPDAATWEFAFSERVDLDPPAKSQVIGETLINTAALDIVKTGDALQTFPRRRGKVQHWEDYINRTNEQTVRKSDAERMHQAFALLLILEMAYAAADIFPIEVISRGSGDSFDQKIMYVVSRVDKDRSNLSTHLGLEPPASRLRKLLSSETPRDEGGWIFSEPGTLGDRSPANTAWRFVDFEELNDLECMKFEGQAFPQTRSFGFLVPADMAGRIAQFKRRLKALTALKYHGELLRMFVDPRLRIEDSQDPLDENAEEFKRLDESKQKALREILSTIPLFLLQGPPGVGKTYLVGDLVTRRMDDDPTARILLSAQSNSAIDHLMKELQATFKLSDEDSGPLMVRARAADDDDAAGELEIDVQADKLLQDLAASPLMSEASSRLAERVSALASARTGAGTRRSNGEGSGRRIAAELRAFEGMILRAANLVFATTNSAAVERLIEEQGLFDWTVVEEAGKATGGELLSPLLLSHRRLMIGDHKQLPPFDVDKMAKLLSSTSAVQEVVKLADSFVSRYLKDPGIDETFDEVSKAGDDFGRTCAEALSLLTLFGTFVERELSRQKKRDIGPRIARRLNEQYRMHPAIARIVSKCFYDGELKTNAKQAAKFASEPAPLKSSNAAILPDKPLVFIDMPYSREEGPGGRGGEKAPPWSNPDEAAAVVQILRYLAPFDSSKRPSLAVLSPYWQQVRRIERLIDQNRSGYLANLSGFTPAVDVSGFCGTVDSFQGGEADAVVVSMVRNNHHATPARALGFLRDNRRMNVILSRAKWRLIIVGSLSFYRHIVSVAQRLPDQDIGFLSDFLAALEAEKAAGNASIVPWSVLEGARK